MKMLNMSLCVLCYCWLLVINKLTFQFVSLVKFIQSAHTHARIFLYLKCIWSIFLWNKKWFVYLSMNYECHFVAMRQTFFPTQNRGRMHQLLLVTIAQCLWWHQHQPPIENVLPHTKFVVVVSFYHFNSQLCYVTFMCAHAVHYCYDRIHVTHTIYYLPSPHFCVQAFTSRATNKKKELWKIPLPFYPSTSLLLTLTLINKSGIFFCSSTLLKILDLQIEHEIYVIWCLLRPQRVSMVSIHFY